MENCVLNYKIQSTGIPRLNLRKHEQITKQTNLCKQQTGREAHVINKSPVLIAVLGSNL